MTVVGTLGSETFMVQCPGCPAGHVWDGEQMGKEQQCDDCGKTYIPVRPEDEAKEQLLEVVKSIRKSDCGAWLKDCNGIHLCSEGREKRQELMRLLDKLYNAAKEY
jgi:hypothetical protein